MKTWHMLSNEFINNYKYLLDNRNMFLNSDYPNIGKVQSRPSKELWSIQLQSIYNCRAGRILHMHKYLLCAHKHAGINVIMFYMTHKTQILPLSDIDCCLGPNSSIIITPILFKKNNSYFVMIAIGIPSSTLVNTCFVFIYCF